MLFPWYNCTPFRSQKRFHLSSGKHQIPFIKISQTWGNGWFILHYKLLSNFQLLLHNQFPLFWQISLSVFPGRVSFRSLILHTAAPQYQYKVLSDSFDSWHLPPLIPSPAISLSIFFRRTCSCMMVLTNTWIALTTQWTLSRGFVFKFANNPSKIIGSCAGFPGWKLAKNSSGTLRKAAFLNFSLLSKASLAEDENFTSSQDDKSSKLKTPKSWHAPSTIIGISEMTCTLLYLCGIVIHREKHILIIILMSILLAFPHVFCTFSV